MLKMKMNLGRINNFFQQAIQIIGDCVVEEYIEWAKQDDEYLRANNGFVDHTGNLRSSLGAAVIRDAKVEFMTPFQTILYGQRGSAEGKQAIERLVSHYQGKIAKIMVAGMPYAQLVEDIDSKDVLESRRIQCEREAREVIERALRKASERIRKL